MACCDDCAKKERLWKIGILIGVSAIIMLALLLGGKKK